MHLFFKTAVTCMFVNEQSFKLWFPFVDASMQAPSGSSLMDCHFDLSVLVLFVALLVSL